MLAHIMTDRGEFGKAEELAIKCRTREKRPWKGSTRHAQEHELSGGDSESLGTLRRYPGDATPRFQRREKVLGNGDGGTLMSMTALG
jgi:hypothetical protein